MKIVAFPDYPQRLRRARLKLWLDAIERHVEGMECAAQRWREDFTELLNELPNCTDELCRERRVRQMLRELEYDCREELCPAAD